MDKEAMRDLAIKSVDSLLTDIESSVKRGSAVFGPEQLLTSLIPLFIGYGTGIDAALKVGQVYTGERRNLTVLLGCRDWVSTFYALHEIVKGGFTGDVVKAGDYFRLPIKADAGKFDGLEFEELDIAETEIVVTQVCRDRIILNFDEVLFFSAVNAKNTNKGGFKESALSQYLNTQFLDALDPVKEILAKNKDGNRVTLPTLYEVAADDDFGSDVNWEEEPRQLEYFKKIKNRIRTKGNDTKWYWLSNAAVATDFAVVDDYGDAYIGVAGSAGGGVSPAICVA
jgi:hypothetical protein